MNNLNKYDKYYVERDRHSGMAVEKDGEPVLEKLEKGGCPLEEKHVRILNRSWRKTGIYYQKQEVKEIKIGKSDKRLALEKEADELGVKFRENIGDEKLEQKINEAKQE